MHINWLLISIPQGLFFFLESSYFFFPTMPSFFFRRRNDWAKSSSNQCMIKQLIVCVCGCVCGGGGIFTPHDFHTVERDIRGPSIGVW